MPGDFVGQSQKLGVPFDQESPRALVAAIFGGLFANAGALVIGNRVKANREQSKGDPCPLRCD